MKKLALVFAVVLLSIQSSNACSMMPYSVEDGIKRNNLKAVAVAALNIQQEDVLGINVLKSDGGYIWNNPMCPEGSWVEAEFGVSFNDDDPLSTGCYAVVKVRRSFASRVIWGGEVRHEAHNTFKVDIVQEGICLQ